MKMCAFKFIGTLLKKKIWLPVRLYGFIYTAINGHASSTDGWPILYTFAAYAN